MNNVRCWRCKWEGHEALFKTIRLGKSGYVKHVRICPICLQSSIVILNPETNMPNNPSFKIRASEALLQELIAAQKALKRTKALGSRDCPKIESLIVQVYNARQKVSGALEPSPSHA